ncbi:uncharacterized protein [Macrobrachium rosenbergii]|uniref:uncharacterized protein isoform X2 n=1 Tax=Macrobrachium rosenbergii TaxID=79674 RepID=UPI0034D45141
MTNAGDMNQAMMPSDCSFSETDLNDNITAAEESIDSVLKQAEWVHKKCDEKRAEWTTKLSRAESEVRQAVRDQFSQAFSYLELWEDQFQTELCEAFSKRRVLMEEKLNDINSLQTYLHRTMFTTMGRIKAAVESKDLPFQEANTLLDIAGKIMAEIKSVEVLPQITFHKVEEFFNDENQQRFGYLATLDVLPHQVVLLYPNNIVCGPIVFVVQVPQTRFMTTLTKSIESTIQVGERDPENLRVYQHNSNLEIVLNVESKETHVLSVKLYHQHVVGSPFLFHPTLNKQPYEDLKIKSSASHPLREDFDWVTDSTSEEEFISVTKESLRNQMSCSGIRMARKALLGKKQNIIRKRVKPEEQMDMCRKEKVSQRFTSQEEPTITTKFEVNIGNPANHKGKVDQFTNGNIADDEDDYEEKAHRAMLSNKQNTAMQPIDHEWFNPVLTSPNNEKGIEVNQNMNDGANHVKIEETIAPQSTECEENGSDDIMQKASRKAVKLSQPLRRPRLPACLTNVPGSFTYNISTKEIQSALSTEEIKSEPVTGKLVGEHHESSQGAYQKAEKQSSVIESREIGVCTSRQDDWRNASEDKTFNYMLSQVSLFAGKQRNLEGKADKVSGTSAL